MPERALDLQVKTKGTYQRIKKIRDMRCSDVWLNLNPWNIKFADLLVFGDGRKQGGDKEVADTK